MALKMETPQKAVKEQSPTDYESHLASKQIVGNVEAVKIQKDSSGKEISKQILTNEQILLNPGVLVNKQRHLSLWVSGGRTISDGNYGSYRFDVGLTVPCDPEYLQEAYEFGTDWVSEKIEATVKEAKGY
jgi:hypothetical protein